MPLRGADQIGQDVCNGVHAGGCVQDNCLNSGETFSFPPVGSGELVHSKEVGPSRAALSLDPPRFSRPYRPQGYGGC